MTHAPMAMNASDDSAVSMRGLGFLYPGTRALDDVSFSVARGSATALVGPNGAAAPNAS